MQNVFKICQQGPDKGSRDLLAFMKCFCKKKVDDCMWNNEHSDKVFQVKGV